VCTGYKADGKAADEFDPAGGILERVECVYEQLAGWGEEITQARRYADLPAAARAYVEKIESLMGRPVGIISVGPDREQTIPHHTKLGDV